MFVTNKKWRFKMDRSNNTSIKLSAGFNLDEFTISQVADAGVIYTISKIVTEFIIIFDQSII
jgi:hypothetical protein